MIATDPELSLYIDYVDMKAQEGLIPPSLALEMSTSRRSARRLGTPARSFNVRPPVAYFVRGTMNMSPMNHVRSALVLHAVVSDADTQMFMLQTPQDQASQMSATSPGRRTQRSRGQMSAAMRQPDVRRDHAGQMSAGITPARCPQH